MISTIQLGTSAAYVHTVCACSKFLIDFLQVYGKVDLEQPAPACEQTLLVVNHNLGDKVGHNITVPLHSKYPQVTAHSNGSGIDWENISGGFTHIEIPSPIITLHGRRGQHAMVSCKSNQLEWIIPAGSVAHYNFVMYGTALVVIISATIVAWGILTINLRTPLEKME